MSKAQAYLGGDKPHGILEDIAAEIGYTATTLLVDWLGNTSVYVPKEATPGHKLERIIGRPAFVRLCKAFGDEVLHIPIDYLRDDVRRNRTIANLLEQGRSPREIGRIVGLSERRVQQIKGTLEELGLLPQILTKPAAPQNGAGAPGLL